MPRQLLHTGQPHSPFWDSRTGLYMSFSNSGLDTRKYAIYPQTTPLTGTRNKPGSRVANWELALMSGNLVRSSVTPRPRRQLVPG